MDDEQESRNVDDRRGKYRERYWHAIDANDDDFMALN